MASNAQQNGLNEEESFIILGSTSPKNSFDMAMIESKISQCTKSVYESRDDKESQDVDPSASTSSAHNDQTVPSWSKMEFKIDKQPSPATLELASSIMSELSSTSDIQHKIGELLNENVILRKTLNQNNISMKDQFKTIAQWQEDMMTTHELHKKKFAETKELIEKLRSENTYLKKEIDLFKQKKANGTLVNGEPANAQATSSGGPLSTEGDRTIIESLMLSLESIEKQRRQVIEQNEKLQIVREKLEHDSKQYQDMLNQKNEQNEELQSIKKKLERENLEFQDKLSAKTEEHNIWKQKMVTFNESNKIKEEKLKAERDGLEKSVKDLTERNITLSKILSEVTSQDKKSSAVDEQLQSQRENLLNSKIKIDEYARENEKFKIDLSEATQKMEKLTMEKSALKSELETLKKEKNAAMSIDSDFVITPNNKLSHSDLENTIDVLTSQLNLLGLERGKAIQEKDLLKVELDTRDATLIQKTGENEDLKLMIVGMKEEMKKNAEDNSLEEKVSSLHSDLKQSKIKLMEAENVKIEYTQYKLDTQDTIKQLKERLRDAQKIAFQPVRYSVSLESQCDSSEFSNFIENVKLYDKTLKDIAEYLNQYSEIFSTMFDTVSCKLTEAQNSKTDISSIRRDLGASKECIDKHYSTIPNLNHQLKSALSFYEKLFLDYQQVLKLLKDHENKRADFEGKANQSDQLTAENVDLQEKLSALRREKAMLVDIVNTLQKESEERDLLRAQLDVYKTDFEAERDSRTQMASEKEEILTNLRTAQQRNQELSEELDRFRTKNPQPSTSFNQGRQQQSSSHNPNVHTTNALNHENNDSPPPGTGRFACPVCDNTFKCVKMLQDHVESCLEYSQRI